ncbi:IclR family transcriptional regulator [Streptomyces flaveolus]|uniref:IclR family transcriptional regulator n=1 Tax=Streptomyces flaveolus TaxID=67297 RepID=UPI00382715CF
MARPSPAVTRIAAVLTFLADDPLRSFTLTEIARNTGLSPATAHALLNQMATEGLLVRDPNLKRYTLGPLLVRIGQAASARPVDAVGHARELLDELSHDIGLQVTLTRVIGEHIVVEARVGDPGPWGMTVQVGQRLPMAPPLGSVFVAWAADAEIEHWLRRADAEPSAGGLDRCLDALGAVREHGFAVSLNVPATSHSLSGDASGLRELLDSSYFLVDLQLTARYSIRQIAAPVFDVDGNVVLAVSALHQGAERTGREVLADGGLLSRAADLVTASIHGRKPAIPDHEGEPV